MHGGGGSSDIGIRAAMAAHPPPYTHLTGSLFATYTGAASCFLQTAPYGTRPCLVGVPLPSDLGGLQGHIGLPGSACVPCPAHNKTPLDNYPAGFEGKKERISGRLGFGVGEKWHQSTHARRAPNPRRDNVSLSSSAIEAFGRTQSSTAHTTTVGSSP